MALVAHDGSHRAGLSSASAAGPAARQQAGLWQASDAVRGAFAIQRAPVGDVLARRHPRPDVADPGPGDRRGTRGGMGPLRPATRARLRIAAVDRTSHAGSYAEWHAATDATRQRGPGEPPGRAARRTGGRQEAW